MCPMRMTISMEGRLAASVRREAAARDLSVSAFIAQVLDDFLKRPEPAQVRPFRLITVSGEGPRAGIDLDRPRALESRDDEERYR